MKIGFPIVVESGGSAALVYFWLERIADNRSGLYLKNPTDGKLTRVTPEDHIPPLYKTVCAAVLETQWAVQLTIQSKSPSALNVVFDSNSNEITFSGASGTLAFFLFSKFGDIAGNDVLITGEAHYIADKWVVKPLGDEPQVVADIKTKLRLTTANAFWMHRIDFDAQYENQELYAKNLEDKKLRLFASPSGSPNWLIWEFGAEFNLSNEERNVRCQFDKPADVPPGTPEESQLFQYAIDFDSMGEETSQALQATLKARKSRYLLPIQAQALETENLSRTPIEGTPPGPTIFYNLDRKKLLRHAIIHGPTGCGKTTLLHALVLNGLHNRGGGVLYVGPVKALVEEFHRSVEVELAGLLPTESTMPIVFSTGDFAADDSLIAQGRFGLAAIVNEKANVLISGEDHGKLLGALSLVLIDEMHMLQDPSRGGVLDLFIAKVIRENKRRLAANEPKLVQLVFISTEGLANRVNKLELLQIRREGTTGSPVFLSTTLRPVHAHHRLAVLAEKRGLKMRPIYRDIVTFDSDKKRQQTSAALRTITQSTGPNRDENEWKDLIQTNLSGGHFYEQIVKLILDVRDRRLSIVAAVPGTEMSFLIAEELALELKHALDKRELPEGYEDELKRSGMPQATVTNFLAWARVGVFVHNSQLPAKLRRKIEEEFRKPLHPNSRPIVLISTETLTYGVNLSVSCMIVCSLKWPRSDPIDQYAGVSPNVWLDQNQYHNLTGRAGRRGYTEEAAECIICIPASLARVDARRLAFLERFYMVEEPREWLSSIIQPKDLENFVYDDDKKTVTDSSPHTELTGYSFSAFRTTIDALRAAGNSATVPQVLDVVSNTIAYSVAKADRKMENLAKLHKLIEVLLVKLAEYEKGEIRLVSHTNQLYTARGEGLALIDTGTHLSSVQPLAIWLEELRSLETELVGDPQKLAALSSAQAVLPGLVATPDFMRVAAELVCEPKDVQGVGGKKLEKHLEIAKLAALEELNLCNLKFLSDTITSYLQVGEISNGLRVVALPEKRPIVYWALLTSVLRWLRGSSLEDVKAPLKIMIDRKKGWQPKHSERLELLARMCYRFFMRSEGFLSEKQHRELPRLALQLKFGIPFAATPYLNIFSADGVMPRDAVVGLHRALPDPFRLLKRDAADIALVESVVNAIESNVKNADDVIEVVRKSYTQHLHSFLNGIDRDSARDFIDDVRGLIMTPDDPEFDSHWEPAPLIQILTRPKHLQSLKDSHIEIEKSDGAAHLVFSEVVDGVNTYVRFGSTFANAIDGVSSIRLLSWHEGACEGCTITPCAFLLYMSLVLRGCVGLRDLSREIPPVGESIRIDVLWVAANLWKTEDLSNMQALREDLFGFIEPSSPW
jgi:hypothetical protein